MSGAAVLTVSYVLLAVFVVGFVVRCVTLARLPLHLRWELAPVPHESGRRRYGGSYFEEFEWWTRPRGKSRTSELAYMLREILLLKAVWEENRRLWWLSFPLHLGLYLLGGAVVMSLAAVALGMVGVAAAGSAVVRAAIAVLAGSGSGLGAVGAAGLLARRVLDAGLADFSPPASLLNLALLVILFATGLLAVARTPYAAGMAAYLHALVTARGAAATGGPLQAHVAVGLVFLAYLPFSQMMHFVAKYFTYHGVRWDDEPMVTGSRMEREVRSLLAQPVSWAAPHLGADGRKNWVDIATGGAGR